LSELRREERGGRSEERERIEGSEEEGGTFVPVVVTEV
jgi:hypothetical protein